MADHVFILAGGSGTRLWPASTRDNPKQFIELKEGKSLLQLTIERALGLDVEGKIFLITLKEQMQKVAEECAKITKGKEKLSILPEPVGRNTAPAIALAARYLQEHGQENNTVLVLPADHLISPIENFRSDAKKAANLAGEGYLVTFGIPPERPETGYGYIEAGEQYGGGYMVRSFREKPDEKTANEFYRKGNYYWNSGMFTFKAQTYLNELACYSPEIYKVFEGLSSGNKTREIEGITVAMEGAEIDRAYERSPSNSIDYAVMEKSRKTAMIKATFSWTDVGSWDEVARLQLVSERKVFSEEAERNFVFSDLPVALCGVSGLAVVIKNGIVLICKRGSSQLVKRIVTQLEESGEEELL